MSAYLAKPVSQPIMRNLVSRINPLWPRRKPLSICHNSSLQSTEVYLQRTARVTLMAEKDFSSALIYHEATKHSEVSIAVSAHYLDWDNKPAQFKEYKNLPSIALPRDFPLPKKNSINTITGDMKDAGAKQIDI